MGETTKIGWTRSTFNPWIGCAKVSPGCAHCFAEVQAKRIPGSYPWGVGQPRRAMSKDYWRGPIVWNRKAAKTGEFWPVFCGSLCDVMDNESPEGVRDQLWDLIRATPALTWQLCTKRPENLSLYLPSDWNDGYSNVWIIVTVENNRFLVPRLTELYQIPALIRGISFEPLLECIDISNAENELLLRRADWFIIGGESGFLARPFPVRGARVLLEFGRINGIPCFTKQVGANPQGCETRIFDRKGANPVEWPPDLRVQQIPLMVKL